MSDDVELPASWVQIDFDEAIEVISDRGLRIKQKDYLPTGELPVIDQGEGLIGGYTNDLNTRVVSSKPVIVFGDHTRRFKFVKFPFAVGADGVKLFAPNEIWNPVFLYLQLGTINLEDRGYGRHYQHLRKELLGLPPLHEQTRIVEKLEELLSDLDAGVAELKAAQKKLGQYRQSLLKAAVEGALTAEWRAQNHPKETGAQLLERILTERRARWEARQLDKFKEQGKTPPMDWQKKYPEPVKPDTSKLPELPDGWVWASGEQLCEFITKGTTPPKELKTHGDKNIPFLRVTNLTDRGHLDLTDKVFVSNEIHKGFLARSAVYPNDVLMNIVGPPLGQVVVVPDTFSEWNINQAIAIFRAVDGVLPSFICHYLLSVVAQQWLKARSKTTAGQTNLTLEICRALPFPLPPREEQHAILTLLESVLGSISGEISVIELGIKQSAAQRKNILKAAFSGQLVPQDPNDEPASVLLERIRAERAVRDRVKKPRPRKPKEAA